MGRDVIEQLGEALRLPPRSRRSITRELSSHLDETRRELLLAGWHPDAARRESIERLGDPVEIADGFKRVYRPTRRSQLGMAFVLAGGMILGVYGIGGGFASARTQQHAFHHHVSYPRRGPVR